MLMRKILSVLFFVCCVAPLLAQDNISPEWDKETLARANSAAECTYMSADEKQIIFYCNLARMNGKLFATTYAKQYYKDKKVKSTSYSKSLITELNKLDPLPPFQPAEDLYNAAFAHAVTSGKKGTTGHQQFESRFKKHAPGYNPYGENCSYGNHRPLDFVMSLLIDEGIKGLGHRKNIFSKQFSHVGVAIHTHKKYKYNAVMDFGKK